MSVENANAFFKKIETDQTLQDEYKTLLADCKGLVEDEIMGKISRFSSDKGFDISAEDIRAVAVDMKEGELSEEELEAVAGGGASLSFYIFGDANFSSNYKRSTFCLIAGWAQSDD